MLKQPCGKIISYLVPLFYRIICFALISFLTFALVTGWIPTVVGQLPSISRPSTQPQVHQPPPGVERLGAIEVAPVMLDGRKLFMVAAPTVWDRSKLDNQILVEVRVEQIEQNLNRVIGRSNIQLSLSQGIISHTAYDPKTLQVYVADLNQKKTIFVKDQDHHLPLSLLTVTQADVEYWGIPINQVADSMRAEIDRQLHEALLERSTPRLDVQLFKAVFIGLAVISLSLMLWLFRKLLHAKDKLLKAKHETEAAQSTQTLHQTTSKDDPAFHRLTILSRLRHKSNHERQHSVIMILQWLVLWGQLILWGGGILLILSLFPWTKQLSWNILSLPLKLLGIWFVVGLTNRLIHALLNLLEKFWNKYHIFGTEDEQRESLRIATTISVLKGLKIALIYAIALLLGLEILGAPIGSVLALSGLIAVAISLSFQNLAKDLVTGCLILWEDQFAIGDIIAIHNTSGKISSGLVENMNLRITQIRSEEGRLITIPNSTILQVENMTRSWSRVSFSVEVAYETDIDVAIAAIEKAGQQMYQESKYREQILEPPEVLGVESLSHTGMAIRVYIKTKPSQQWRVDREFRRYVRIALDQHNIVIGKPQQDLWYKTPPSSMNGAQKKE